MCGDGEGGGGEVVGNHIPQKNRPDITNIYIARCNFYDDDE